MRISLTQPIRTCIAVPAAYLAKDISYLVEVTGTTHTTSTVLKLINVLRRNGFHTIEDVVNATARRIQLIKQVGDKTFVLLLDLLKALSEEGQVKPANAQLPVKLYR
jgi:hypothetical protein